MATNTILTKSDRVLVTELFNGELSGEFYDDYITNLGGWSMFASQRNVTKVDMPNLVSINASGEGSTHLGGFWGCTSLKEFHSNKNVRVDTQAFRGCSSLEKVDCKLLINTGTASDYASHLFYACSNLKEVDLSLSTLVRQYTFYECSSLTNVSLDTCTTIGSTRTAENYVFQYCTALRRVYAPLVTTIKTSGPPFDYDTSLEIVRIPSYAGSTNLLGAGGGNQGMKLLDFGSKTSIVASEINALVRWTKILILRKTDAITTLANSTAFNDSTTPSPIKVYVPSALKSSYEAGTNWSTVLANNYVAFYDLEGSPYEQPDFDDTAIYNADRSTL